jgi:hypothetical protein
VLEHAVLATGRESMRVNPPEVARSILQCRSEEPADAFWKSIPFHESSSVGVEKRIGRASVPSAFMVVTTCQS